MKKIYVIMIIALVIGAISTIGFSEPQQDAEVIHIAAIQTLTGDAAFYGTQSQKGIDLAIEYLADVYPHLSFEVHHADSGFTAKGGIDAYGALAQQYPLDIVITQASPISIATQSIIAEDNLFHMAMLTSAAEYSSPDDYSYRVSALTDDEGEPMSRYIHEKEYKKLAVLFFQNEIGVSSVESLEKFISENSPETEIVFQEGFSPSEQDFRTLIAKVKEADVDALYIAGLSKNIGNILNQSEEMNLDVPVLSFRIAEDPALIDQAGDNAEGLVYTYAFDVSEGNNLTDNFVTLFRNKYGVNPDGYNAESFMGTILLGNAVHECGVDNECIATFLNRNEGHETIFGKVTFDANGDISHEFFLKEIRDGEFARLQ